MTNSQQKQIDIILDDQPLVVKAQISNAIDQVLDGTMETRALKWVNAWQKLSDNQRVEISKLVNIWAFRSTGHTGIMHNLKSVYKDKTTTSVILPAKFVV